MISLVPAYILGRFLPSEAAFKGGFSVPPFDRITVSFTGAFALYAAMLFAGSYFIVRSPAFEMITIEAELRLDRDETHVLDPRAATAVFHPPMATYSPPTDAVIFATLEAAARRNVNGTLELPQSRLLFQYPGHYAAGGTLEAAQVKNGKLWLGEVVLRKINPRAEVVAQR